MALWMAMGVAVEPLVLGLVMPMEDWRLAGGWNWPESAVCLMGLTGPWCFFSI